MISSPAQLVSTANLHVVDDATWGDGYLQTHCDKG